MTEVTICEACDGNGFVRTPHSKFSDQWEIEQCDACRSSGEARASLTEPEDRR